MQQNDETRFEDFVGLISGLYKEIQRIKTSEGARLGLKGSDIMCLYYLERSKDGLTGADPAGPRGHLVLARAGQPRQQPHHRVVGQRRVRRELAELGAHAARP